MKQGVGVQTADSGFTMVETLIVLAVTGLMFASAIVLINGRQASTQFQTGINSLQQQFTQIINQSQSGYYPSSDNLVCATGAAGSPHSPPRLSVSAKERGTNGGCQFIGSVFRFGIGGATPDDSTEDFTVYPVAANRLNGVGNPVTGFAEARPIPLAPGITYNNDPRFPDNGQVYKPDFGITLIGWQAKSATGANYAADPARTPIMIGLYSDLTAGTSGDTLASGAVQTYLYGFAGYSPISSPKTFVDSVVSSSADPARPPFKLSSITLCFASGGTNQSGQITIGGSGGLQVSLQVFQTSKDCTT